GEGVGVRLPRDDVAENAQPGDAGDVADHGGELEVHLDQRFLHALGVDGSALHQSLAVAQKGAQGRDRGGRAEAAAQQSGAIDLLEPLAVHDIGFAARDVLYVTRVNEDYVEAPRLEDLVEGDSVDAGGFHRHCGDAAGRAPVGEAVELGGNGLERAYGGRVTVGGDGDVMLLGPAVDASGIRVDPGQAREAGRRLLRAATLRLLHGMLLSPA